MYMDNVVVISFSDFCYFSLPYPSVKRKLERKPQNLFCHLFWNPESEYSYTIDIFLLFHFPMHIGKNRHLVSCFQKGIGFFLHPYVGRELIIKEHQNLHVSNFTLSQMYNLKKVTYHHLSKIDRY